jgi:Flp pilus assembly protein TadG
MLKLFKKLVSAESGSIIPMLAFAMFSITGLVGVAVDSSRAYLVQSRMSTALDAAGLAAGSTINTANVQEEATKYMNANYPTGYAGSQLLSVTATPSLDKTVIELKAVAEVPTVFMGLFGHDEMTVEVKSQITRTSKGMELALVLDVTGSMAGSKLTAAKTAAKDLLNILYGDRNTVDDLWVGLVPFAQAVNVGPTRTSWVNTTYMNSLNWGTTSWDGCVEARETNNHDVDDENPEDQPYRVYYWPDHGSYNDWVRVTAVPVYETVCTDRYCGRGRNRYVCGQDCEEEVVGYQNVTSYVIDSDHGPMSVCWQ